MTQNSNINPSFQLGGNSYGHIRFQHYQYYQKLCSPHKKSEIRGFAGRASVRANARACENSHAADRENIR